MKILALVTTILLSQNLLAAGNAAKGQKLYASCIQCHGEKGEGNPAQKAPKIAGQHDWYIISSIKAFQAGKDRKNPTMLPYIKGLSEQDIADLAAYVSKM